MQQYIGAVKEVPRRSQKRFNKSFHKSSNTSKGHITNCLEVVLQSGTSAETFEYLNDGKNPGYSNFSVIIVTNYSYYRQTFFCHHMRKNWIHKVIHTYSITLFLILCNALLRNYMYITLSRRVVGFTKMA